MAVRTDKTDLISDLMSEIERATTTRNRISPMEMFDILQSIVGLLVANTTTSAVPSDRLWYNGIKRCL